MPITCHHILRIQSAGEEPGQLKVKVTEYLLQEIILIILCMLVIPLEMKSRRLMREYRSYMQRMALAQLINMIIQLIE